LNEPERISYDVQIRWTSFGIPHIKAATYASLAFGVGYAYARDNTNLLADAILTVRGVRSLYFGPDAMVPHQSMSNLDSDFFHKFYFDAEELQKQYMRRAPFSASMLSGYADGAARLLSDCGSKALSSPYREAFDAKPICVSDLYLLLAQKAAQTSGCAFASAIIAAHPPDSDELRAGGDTKTTNVGAGVSEEGQLGSNAFALGRDVTGTGAGLLVGNPHFPWFGSHRFYQMHLTIPGELDVMGASLPPFPLVNIGFNRDVAWTHTVSPSRRFIIYELNLTRGYPFRYRVGFRNEQITRHCVSVAVREASGEIGERRRTFYRTRYGPLMTVPEMGCTWTKRRAFAFHDTAANCVTLLSQWRAINKAQSIHEIHNALSTHRGALWLNTVAADRMGEVFYGNLTAAPDVSWWMRATRLPSRAALLISWFANIVVLSGSSVLASMGSLSAVRRVRLRPSKKMPIAIRSDYVLNCNDSHWLTHAKKPLTGYPRFLGLERVQQGLRTRMAHRELSDLLERRSKGLDAEDFKELVFSNRNYAAELVMTDLLRLEVRHVPVTLSEGRTVELGPAFSILRSWSWRDDLNSPGAVLFREFWRKVQGDSKIWKTPFDPKKPLTTPRGLRTENPEIADFLLTSLAESVLTLEKCGFPLDITLGAVQRIFTDDGAIAIPGGLGSAGVLNLIDFGPLTESGYEPTAIQGTSYTQFVTWDHGQVIADAILPFSQSTEKGSAHAWDQTRLFSEKKWVRLPFDEADINADPNLTVVNLSHRAISPAGAAWGHFGAYSNRSKTNDL
jgi:acyl-homoserine-lactone acylase